MSFPFLRPAALRAFALLVTALVLAGCKDVQSVGQVNSDTYVANIGTRDAPAYSTAGLEKSQVARQIAGRAQVDAGAFSSFYAGFDNQTAWNKGRGWKPAARSSLKILQNSWQHGLQPNHYLPKSLRSLGFVSVEQDQALSAAMIKYVSDVRFGRTRPNHAAAAQLLTKALRSPDFDSAIAALEPQGQIYQRVSVAASRALRSRKATAPNFNALEVTMEKLRTQGEPAIGAGPKVVVNIAAFDLQGWDNGRVELPSKVIVGKEGRSSPIGPDKITNLKFSPDWTAPRSIVERDILPNLQKNPAQYENFGMEIKVRGRVVKDLKSYDWSTVSARQMQVRQLPGEQNVLGGVRFTLANSNAIYLHDTASRGLFDNVERAGSSGCIRVEKSAELARWVLEKSGKSWSPEQVSDAMTKGKISFVKLNRSIPVEMMYYTAWVDGNGALILVRDIYSRDTEIRNALAAS